MFGYKSIKEELLNCRKAILILNDEILKLREANEEAIVSKQNIVKFMDEINSIVKFSAQHGECKANENKPEKKRGRPRK